VHDATAQEYLSRRSISCGTPDRSCNAS
jgi:hypothetical protein